MVSFCIHRSGNTLNRTGPDIVVACGFAHAVALRESLLHGAFLGCINGRASEGLPALCAALARALDASIDTFDKHAALEFGEGTTDAKHHFSHRRRCVDVLLFDEQIATARFEMFDCGQKVDQRSSQPVDGPCHDNAKLALAGVLEHLIQARTILAALGTADPCILICLDNFPSAPLSDVPKLLELVLDGLVIGADTDIDRGALHLC